MGSKKGATYAAEASDLVKKVGGDVSQDPLGNPKRKV
jgi:hypothetical protein